eukprot:7383936-Prymnesium_polylepis.1
METGGGTGGGTAGLLVCACVVAPSGGGAHAQARRGDGGRRVGVPRLYSLLGAPPAGGGARAAVGSDEARAGQWL